jgi:hypothetical protein
MKVSKSIFVTQPSLAPLEEYMDLLRGVWESGILTHNGPLVQKFESDLSKKLGLNNFIAVSNGTIAIQMAIKALEIQGEIITTPFTWIASVSAIKWEGCNPVFCDIDPQTLNINPEKIEALITDKTVAIMPVHVFGNPCEVKSIETIAKKHNIKVIYDAAHAVGSRCFGKSILEYGDISATSLHATKLLNSAEGGGCITKNSDLEDKLKRIRFFGHDENKDVVEDGFNGKMTEVHAALGLANLRYFDSILADRKKKYLYYRDSLTPLEFLSFQEIRFGEPNYSYFPIIIDSEERLTSIERQLNEQFIYPRRYFYPSVNTYSIILPEVSMPISEDVAKRILCLPLYYELNYRVIDIIIKIIRNI